LSAHLIRDGFVDEHLPRVYRFALRLTGSRQEAEDLAQETFLRAWRRRGQLRDPRATSVWLLSIARNLWNDRLRRKARGAAGTEPLGEDYPSAGCGPDQDSMVREDLRQVLEAMDELPARQREVLYLFARQGLSLREIAAVLEITPEAAKASLCEARKRLRQRFRQIDCAVLRNERDVP
jgi:RNA polymerase sigma-70 factor, ECF subfamily